MHETYRPPCHFLLKILLPLPTDINSSMAGIPEDKSNMLPMDVECLDVMDPAAQGAYADLPVDEAPLFVTRISPSGPTSSFSPQVRPLSLHLPFPTPL